MHGDKKTMKVRITSSALTGLEKYRPLLEENYNLRDPEFDYFADTKQLIAGTVELKSIDDIISLSSTTKKQITLTFTGGRGFDFSLNICS